MRAQWFRFVDIFSKLVVCTFNVYSHSKYLHFCSVHFLLHFNRDVYKLVQVLFVCL